MQRYCKDGVKGTQNEEMGMQKQHRYVHCLPFPPAIYSVNVLADVRAGAAMEKEQLWALPALLVAALQGPHWGELPAMGCPSQCYLISAPNWLLHNLFLP